ncbi:unnamed protein product, partial [Heterosigma akashiwo]
GVDQPIHAKGSSPGYNHAKYWPGLVVRERATCRGVGGREGEAADPKSHNSPDLAKPEGREVAQLRRRPVSVTQEFSSKQLDLNKEFAPTSYVGLSSGQGMWVQKE